jgi:hypothetical protein
VYIFFKKKGLKKLKNYLKKVKKILKNHKKFPITHPTATASPIQDLICQECQLVYVRASKQDNLVENGDQERMEI